MQGSLLQMGCTLSSLRGFSLALFRTSYLAMWHHVLTSLHNPFNPGDSTTAKAPASSVASTGLSRTKPWLLSRTLSCLRNQYHLAKSYTLLSSSASTRDSLGTLWTSFCVLTLRKDSRRSYLNDAGLFWITINFSALLNQHWLSQQSKDFTFVVRVSC